MILVLDSAMNWTTDDFDYHLPSELIAQQPTAQRTHSRMLQLSRHGGAVSHGQFPDIVDCLQPQDLLVFNDTKVFPARLFGRKASGGKVECLIERLLDSHNALAHIRSSKSPKPGAVLTLGDGINVRVEGREGDLFCLRLLSEAPFLELLWQQGRLPLPPYIEREVEPDDYERYQTVFADRVGAVAAPTAGLHFDEGILAAIEEKGVSTTKVTLHVGAGTFQPVRVDSLSSHHMHSEWIDVSASVVQAIADCQQRGGRVVAVGTTVLRALETASRGGSCRTFTGDTDIFIYPGFTFHCVDALLTNFHLPKSTLLMLVAAFAGYEEMMQAYQAAIAARYRFFSYGDCMLVG